MIVVRAPLRISFVGGGTDLPDFYRMETGRVLSTAIDKYVYVALNHTPFTKTITVRYSSTETVDHPTKIKNDRVRAALVDLQILRNIEIGMFSHLPARMGLGSSSTFSVALLKALYTYLGQKIDTRLSAEAAARLEIDLLGEPIGKQDHYAAAFGGFNIFHFQKDGSVDVEPLPLSYHTRLALEDHTMVFFTGIHRLAASVLRDQKARTEDNIETLKAMANSVYVFRDALMAKDFEHIGAILHEGWMRKKTLASTISNSAIDTLYDTALQHGAWGGKILGAGGGGCLLFIASPQRRAEIARQLHAQAKVLGLEEFWEIPVQFVQSGVEVLVNANPPRPHFD